MERRYYNLVIKIVINLFVVCAFYQCTPTPPQFEEMIGIWRADDGATIELKSDSTFVIKNFDSFFFHELSNKAMRYKVDAKGKWGIEGEYLGNLLLHISINSAVHSRDSLFSSDKEKSIISNYGENFYIKGDGGVFTDKAPWFIRAVDNFDDYTTYDFHRVE